MAPPSWNPSHPPSHCTPLGCHRAQVWVPEPYSTFPLATCSSYGCAYASGLLSPFFPPSPSHPVATVCSLPPHLHCGSSHCIPTKMTRHQRPSSRRVKWADSKFKASFQHRILSFLFSSELQEKTHCCLYLTHEETEAQRGWCLLCEIQQVRVRELSLSPLILGFHTFFLPRLPPPHLPVTNVQQNQISDRNVFFKVHIS